MLLSGLASYTLGLAVTGNIKLWNIGRALKATFFGALGGAASYGVGEIFKVAAEAGKYVHGFAQAIYDSVGGFGLAVVQAGTHALSQGVLGMVQGQSFASAALSGFAGSLASSGWSSVIGTSGGSMIAFGAFAGGIGAELSGGNFWQGVVIGGIVAGLNHAMHEIDPPKGFKGKKWVDSTGEYENNFDGSYKATGPNGEKYTLLEEVEVSANNYSKILDDAANGIGISSDLKETAFNYAKKLVNDLTNTKYFKYGVKGLGKVTGIYGAYSSTRDFIYKPSWQSGTKAALSILSVTKYVNRTVGLVIGLSDATGLTDWALNKIYGK